eukprot:scaffold57877_cov41-Cyclotella_meneghiniana.AAC.7
MGWSSDSNWDDIGYPTKQERAAKAKGILFLFPSRHANGRDISMIVQNSTFSRDQSNNQPTV